LFLIKELSGWLQGFIKFAMPRIPFLTPEVKYYTFGGKICLITGLERAGLSLKWSRTVFIPF
jgi:hypothetical protein